MHTWLQDARFALRQLYRHPTYALTAVLSMALGIGATAAVFSVLYGVLVDPYPYHDADRMVNVLIHPKAVSNPIGFNIPFTRAELRDIRKLPVVEDATGYALESMLETDGVLPVSVNVAQTTGNMLVFMRDAPLMGRYYSAAEAPDDAAPPPVIVISYLFWKKHFNGEPGVLGRKVEIAHRQYTVIGVTEPRFTWLDADIYMPIPAGTPPDRRLGNVTRVRPGVPLAVASQQLAAYTEGLFRSHPEMQPKDGYWINARTLNDVLLGQFKGTLLLLFGAVLLLLMIGCGNVSILMLARGTARQPELAMRRALGANRGRLARQLLTEAVVVSLAGGVFGIAFAYAGIRLIVALLPQYSIPHEVVIRINVPVLLFSAAISVACGVLFGTWPALEFSRTGISPQLSSGGTRTVTSRSGRVRSLLLTGQIAITLLLLAISGAAMRHFLDAYNAHLGFEPKHMLMTGIDIPGQGYSTYAARNAYFHELIDRIAATPGVSSVTYTSGTPTYRNWQQNATVTGAPPNPRKLTVTLISPSYFATLRIPLIGGRIFTDGEDRRAAHYAVVNQTFARTYLAGANPIGHSIQLPELKGPGPDVPVAPGSDQPFEIIGVVGDVLNDGLYQPVGPQAYIPASILAPPGWNVLLRSEQNPEALVHAISASVRTLNPDQGLYRPRLFTEFLSEFTWAHERFLSVLFLIFSGVAVGLAATGLFATVAYSVEQRTREIGIRMALGSQRSRVLFTVLRGTFVTTTSGVLVGILASLLLSSTIQRWTDSATRDARLLLFSAALFFAIAVLACLVPARRAVTLNPVEALRAE